MRFVHGILQCFFLHILLIRSTDYSDAQASTTTCLLKECKSIQSIYVKRSTCGPDPGSNTCQCQLLEEFSDTIDDEGQTEKIDFTCSRRGKWVPATPMKIKCKRSLGAVSMVKQKFNHHNMKRLNNFAKSLLKVSYDYFGLSTYYLRADVNLPGFSKFMFSRWRQYMNWAHDVIHYVNKRGGHAQLFAIHPKKHMMDCSKPGLIGLRRAIGNDKAIAHELYDFAKKVSYNKRHAKLDPHLELLLKKYTEISVKNVYKIGSFITNIKSFGEEDYSIGEYVLDQKLHDEENEQSP